MRWFMHPSDFSTHPIVSAVRAEFGNEGFGAICRIMEQVAAAWEIKEGEPVPMPRLSLPVKDWRNITDFSPQKFEKFLKICQSETFLCSEYEGKVIHVTMPIMFEYMDNYSRKVLSKSGGATESQPTHYRLQQQVKPEEDKRQNNTGKACSPNEMLAMKKILHDRGISADSQRGENCIAYTLERAKKNFAGYLRVALENDPHLGVEHSEIPQRQNTGPTSAGDVLPGILEKLRRGSG